MAPETVTSRPRTTRASRDRRGESPRQPETADTTPGEAIGVVRFTQALLHMTRPRIELQVAGLRARRTSPDDDIAWWQATVALDRALRHRGAWREAAMAAHLASQAVLAAATRTGLALDADVAAVAQSAGEVSRVLVAGLLDTAEAHHLTRGWDDLLIPEAEFPSPPRPPEGRRHREPYFVADQPRRGRP
ncbi:MAG: hypothetical protein ACRD0S_02100 [Acidimicrobiales bacterium]